MNGFTTIEQSKKLLELGIDIETADMCYSREMYDGETQLPMIIAEGFEVNWTKYLPCWSLSALLDVIKDFSFQTIGDYYLLVNEKHSHCIDSKSKIDACFKMVCWLLGNNFIKKDKCYGKETGRDDRP